MCVDVCGYACGSYLANNNVEIINPQRPNRPPRIDPRQYDKPRDNQKNNSENSMSKGLRVRRVIEQTAHIDRLRIRSGRRRTSTAGSGGIVVVIIVVLW